jgi:hypothetical protein
MTASPIAIRSALPSERAALEELQRRSSMHEPMYREQLGPHPDAIDIPAALISSARFAWPSRTAPSSVSRIAPRMSLHLDA